MAARVLAPLAVAVSAVVLAVLVTAPLTFDGDLVLGTCICMFIAFVAVSLLALALTRDLEAPLRDGRVDAWEQESA